MIFAGTSVASVKGLNYELGSLSSKGMNGASEISFTATSEISNFKYNNNSSIVNNARKRSNYGADNIANAVKLKEFYRQAEKYGAGSIKELNNGKYRFYKKLVPARTQGEMAGARLVREWDPNTGAKRSWYETLDHTGKIRQVRPEPKFTGGVKVHYMFDVDGNYTGSWIP